MKDHAVIGSGYVSIKKYEQAKKDYSYSGFITGFIAGLLCCLLVIFING